MIAIPFQTNCILKSFFQVVYPAGVTTDCTSHNSSVPQSLLWMCLNMLILPFKFRENQPKHTWVITVFLKCVKKEKYKEHIRQTLKVHISVMAKWIQLKFGICVKTAFIGSYKIHTSQLHACNGYTWPHDTLSCVLIYARLHFSILGQQLVMFFDEWTNPRGIMGNFSYAILIRILGGIITVYLYG